MLEEIFFLQNQTNILFITIFLGWSSINIFGSLFAFLINLKQAEITHFLRMNILLGIIGEALGGLIYTVLKANGKSSPSTQQILETSIAMENLLVLAAGLSAILFVIGIFLFLKDTSNEKTLLKGLGLSMITQSIFTFLLVLATYISNQIYTNELIEIIIARV